MLSPPAIVVVVVAAAAAAAAAVVAQYTVHIIVVSVASTVVEIKTRAVCIVAAGIVAVVDVVAANTSRYSSFLHYYRLQTTKPTPRPRRRMEEDAGGAMLRVVRVAAVVVQVGVPSTVFASTVAVAASTTAVAADSRALADPPAVMAAGSTTSFPVRCDDAPAWSVLNAARVYYDCCLRYSSATSRATSRASSRVDSCGEYHSSSGY